MSVFVPCYAEILDDPIEPGRPYTDKKTGAPKTIPAKQTVWLYSGGRFPLKTLVDVDDAAGPMRPGKYLLGGEIFSAGEYDRPKFDARRLKLIPLDDAVKALTGKGNIAAAA